MAKLREGDHAVSHDSTIDLADVRTDRQPDVDVTALRICDDSDCSTVLSRYNDLDACALHAPMVVPRMRGKIL